MLLTMGPDELSRYSLDYIIKIQINFSCDIYRRPSLYARSEYQTQLENMSFDKSFDLTAGVSYFSIILRNNNKMKNTLHSAVGSIKNDALHPAVRSKMLAKLIFASCV